MVISHIGKYVFIAVPKAGSSTIRKSLIAKFSGEQHGPHHNTIVPDECRGYCIFTTVRNPYARAASLYRYCQRQKIHRLHELANKFNFRQFMEWMADRRIDPPIQLSQTETNYYRPEFHPEELLGRDPNQSDFLVMNRNATVIKVEDLEAGFNALPFMTDGTFPETEKFCFPVANQDPAGRNGVPAEMMAADPGLEQAIYHWAGADFINFGYQRFDPKTAEKTTNDATPSSCDSCQDHTPTAV